MNGILLPERQIIIGENSFTVKDLETGNAEAAKVINGRIVWPQK